VAKLVATLAVIVYTPVWVGGWVRAAIAATAQGSVDTGYVTVRKELLASSVAILSTLIAVTAISVVKPWGRTWWTRGAGPRHGRRDRQASLM
jgi:hypothetical protein